MEVEGEVEKVIDGGKRNGETKKEEGAVDQGISSKPTRRRYDQAFDKEEDDDDDELPSNGLSEGATIMEVTSELQEEEQANPVVVKIPCQLPSCTMVFSSTKEYQKHYNLRHLHACSSCRKSLPSSHILELHVLELHDTLFSLMAERKPMYQCLLETCVEKFSNPEERKVHCMSVHNFPELFRFWQIPSVDSAPSNSNNKRNGKKQSGQNNKVEPESSNGTEEAMGLPDIVPESDKKSKSCNNSKGSGGSKPKPMHIAFGHSPHQMFKKNYAFGLQKPRKPKSLQHSKSETMEEDGIDLSKIQDALTTSTSALVLGLIDPKP